MIKLFLPKELFILMSSYPLFQKVILNPSQIDIALTQLASQINKTYLHCESVLGIGILRGCLPFMSDLTKKLNFPLQVEYLQVSSYYRAQKTGAFNCRLLFNPVILKQRNVLIFEDIVDSGETMCKVFAQLQTYDPQSLRVVALYTRVQTNPRFTSDFCAQHIQDGWLIGYGFDYNNYLRNIPAVGILDDDAVLQSEQANDVYCRK